MSSPLSARSNDSNASAIRIFSKEECTYCHKVKDFMKEKNLEFEESKLDPSAEDYVSRRDDLIERTNGHKTFPWIFVGDEFVGGYTEFTHAYNTQKLHALCEKHGMTIPASMSFEEPDF